MSVPFEMECPVVAHVGSLVPDWACAEYVNTGSVSYRSSLRAVMSMFLSAVDRLVGADPIWLEAVNLLVFVLLLIAGGAPLGRLPDGAIAVLTAAALLRRLSTPADWAFRSGVLSAAGIYAVVVSRLWAIECGTEHGVPLLGIGICSLWAAKVVWRQNGIQRLG